MASVASISVSTPCWLPISREAVQIDDAQVRIGGRLADEQPRLGRDRRFHRVVIAGPHLHGLHAESRQVLGAKLAAAVVTLVEEDHFVAGIELGHQQADDRRHAAGEQHGRLAAFERGQLPLGHALARVAVAAVFLARLLLFDEVDHRLRVGERVRRRAEDRIGDRVARLLPRFAAVNAQASKAWAAAARLTVFRAATGRRGAWSFPWYSSGVLSGSAGTSYRCDRLRRNKKPQARFARQLRLATISLCERTRDGFLNIENVRKIATLAL